MQSKKNLACMPWIMENGYLHSPIPEYIELTSEPIKPFLTHGICLDHDSVIQNFFNGTAIFRYSLASYEINRNRKHDHIRELLNIKPKTIEDYDLINRVIEYFENWKGIRARYPVVIHSHGIDIHGNEIPITFQAQNRFFSNRNIAPLSKALSEYTGPAIMLTLTIDPNQIPLAQAWLEITDYWNIFLTRLVIEMKKKGIKIKRSELHWIMVIEAQANGYPHIHAVFLGREWLWDAGNKQEYENDNPHSKNLKHLWGHGSVFINKTESNENVKNPINYIMKYIRKTFSITPLHSKSEAYKRELTQAMLWAFNKRSFHTSRGLIEWLKENSKKEKTEIEWEWDPPVFNIEFVSLNVYEQLQGQKTPLRIVKIEPNVKGIEINENEKIPNPLQNKYSIARKIFLAHRIAQPEKKEFFSVDKQGNPIRYEYYEYFEWKKDYG